MAISSMSASLPERKDETMKTIAAWVALSFALALTGCNTVKGFGQDLQKVGDKIEEKAKK
jgi:predicted small secreted protein